MKKIITTTCFLGIFVLLSNSMHAQTTTFGLRGGVNIANLKNKLYDTPLVGFMGGFYVNVWLGNSNVSFSPELLYTRKGAKGSIYTGFLNDNDKMINDKIKTDIDYIEIPFLFKYNFIPSGPVKPAIYFGPYAAVKVRAETIVTSSDLKEKLDEAAINKTDFGLVIGGSVGFSRFNVGIRYEYGLLDIGKNEDTKLGPHIKTKNRVLSIVAGIGF